MPETIRRTLSVVAVTDTHATYVVRRDNTAKYVMLPGRALGDLFSHDEIPDILHWIDREYRNDRILGNASVSITPHNP